MAKVHPQSCVCVNSELDLFSVPPTQTSIEHGFYVEYHPLSALIDSGPIEFAIPGTGEDYLDLNNTMLKVSAKITKSDTTNVADGDVVGPVNLTLHSLFQQVDVSLNDKLVSSSTNTYPYRAYLETLLDYGDGAKQTQLASAMWYKDTAGHMDSTAIGNNANNIGLRKRAIITNAGSTFEMMGRLHSDIFCLDKAMLNGVNTKIRLVRSKDSFVLMAPSVGNAAPHAYKVKILSAVLYVRKIRLNPSVFLAHAKALEIGNAKYPLKRVECKTFSVSAGSRSHNQENLFLGQLPVKLVMGIVDNDAFNGTYLKNPFNFKHHDLNYISVLIDGQQQPIKPLQPDFANNLVVQSYLSLFSGTGKLLKDEDNGITREDYGNGYTLFAYDLTPDLSEDGGHFNLIKQGSLRVELHFANALPHTVNVVVYAEFENVLEVDKNRNVFFDFAN
jgi:hypothetical protein